MITPMWCLELILVALTKVPFEAISNLPTQVPDLENCLRAHHHLHPQSIQDATAKLQGPLYQVFQCWCDTVHQAELLP